MILSLILTAWLAQSETRGDGACDGIVIVEEFEGASVRGECSTSDGQRRLSITIKNARQRSAGTLKSVHLGFCKSSVVRALAPDGWTVTLDAEGRGVTFSRGGEAFKEPGIRAGRRLGGFVVELNQGWRYAHEASVGWESAGVAKGTDHACLGDAG